MTSNNSTFRTAPLRDVAQNQDAFERYLIDGVQKALLEVGLRGCHHTRSAPVTAPD